MSSKRKKEREKAKKVILRQYVYNIKSRCTCKICGTSEKLTFHHINPNEKKYKICRLIEIRCGKNALRAELNKCVTLCEKCHSKIHNINEFKELPKFEQQFKFKVKRLNEI